MTLIGAETPLEERLLLAGAILLVAVAAAVVARRLSVPILLGFLGLGMLLGSDGPGGIYFDDAELARTIGVLGLIAILFEGGLTADWHDVRRVLVPAGLLSTIGVAVTAAIVGAAAYVAFDLSQAEALLMGAVVGSTDAAAVFATLRFTTLRRRLVATLETESGGNDPAAVALTLGLIAWITASAPSVVDFAVLVVRQLGLGLAIGLVLGYLAAKALPRFPLDLAPFAPVASLGIAALVYGLADAAGASGFLAVYVVALAIGNARTPLRRPIVAFHEGLAFLAQIVLFVVLGLLVFPHELPGVALSALALTAVLLLVARPAAVLACTPFQGFDKRERLFLGWAGLRGAVPIVLATFAMSEHLRASDTIFNAVFFVVIVSTLVQGSTLEPLARRLRLAREARPFYEPPIEVGSVRALGSDILEHVVGDGDAIVGSYVREVGLPRNALIVLIVRDGVGVPPRGSSRVAAGDRLYVVASAQARPEVEVVLDAWESGPMPTPAVALGSSTEP